MIKLKISDMLGKYKMTQKELSEKTGIRRATMSAYYHETIKELSRDHLSAMCKVFDCQLSDLIEYIPDIDEQQNSNCN